MDVANLRQQSMIGSAPVVSQPSTPLTIQNFGSLGVPFKPVVAGALFGNTVIKLPVREPYSPVTPEFQLDRYSGTGRLDHVDTHHVGPRLSIHDDAGIHHFDYAYELSPSAFDEITPDIYDDFSDLFLETETLSSTVFVWDDPEQMEVAAYFLAQRTAQMYSGVTHTFDRVFGSVGDTFFRIKGLSEGSYKLESLVKKFYKKIKEWLYVQSEHYGQPGQTFSLSPEQVLSLVNDPLAGMVLIDDLSEMHPVTIADRVAESVDLLLEGVKKGRVVIKRIRDVHGRNNGPYLTPELKAKIRQVCDEYQYTAFAFDSEEKSIRSSGVVGLQIDCIYISDNHDIYGDEDYAVDPEEHPDFEVNAEIQIRSHWAYQIYFPEHFVYDYINPKKNLKIDPEMPIILQTFLKKLKRLTPAERQAWDDYSNRCYNWAKAKERGEDVAFPQVDRHLLKHPLFDLQQLSDPQFRSWVRDPSGLY